MNRPQDVSPARHVLRPDEIGGPASPFATGKYIPAFDGLRALAVLAVFSSHVGYSWLTGGWIGVGVFFVLSGYLITSILLREWAGTGGISLCRFYRRRLVRLYPALLLMLGFCAFFVPLFGDHGTAAGYLFSAAATGLYGQDLVAGLTGSAHGGFLHTWSLAVEEQFYLLWPPVLIRLLRRRASVLGWALAGTAASWILLALTTRLRPGDAAASYLLPHTRAGELLLGCAVAALLAHQPVLVHPWALPRRLAPVAATGLLLLALVAGKAGQSVLLPVQIPVAAILTAALLIALVAGDPEHGGLTRRLLGWRPLVGLGRISYGFYLFHLPVMTVVAADVPVRWSVQLPLELLITVILATLSYRFVEQPLLRHRRPPIEPAGAIDPTGPAATRVHVPAGAQA